MAGLALAAWALSPPPVRAQTGVSMSVTPTQISPLIAAGDQTGEKITITNRSAAAITVTGGPDAAGQPGDGVSVNVQPSHITLPPGAAAAVTVRISVAADAPPGSVRCLVAFRGMPSGGNDISVIGKVGVVLNVDVIRPVVDTSFAAPLLIDGGDQAVFSLRGRNNDRFPVRLTGSVSTGGLLGGASFSVQSGEVAGGQSAVMHDVWHDPPLIGIGWVTLRISSGVGAPAESRSLVIIFPWKFALMLAGLAAAAAGGFIISGRHR